MSEPSVTSVPRQAQPPAYIATQKKIRMKTPVNSQECPEACHHSGRSEFVQKTLGQRKDNRKIYNTTSLIASIFGSLISIGFIALMWKQLKLMRDSVIGDNKPPRNPPSASGDNTRGGASSSNVGPQSTTSKMVAAARFIDNAQRYLTRNAVEFNVHSSTVVNPPIVPKSSALVKASGAFYFMPVKGIAPPRIGVSLNVNAVRFTPVRLRIR